MARLLDVRLGSVRFCPIAGEGWLTGYAYRQKITINNTGNANALTNYQTRIELTLANFAYSHVLSSNLDIHFTTSNGSTEIYHWLEDWNNGAISHLWAKVPSILASANTYIYMYYGKSGETSNSYRSFDNTFTKDYGETGLVGLWHMDEGAGTTTADSSGNNNTGTLTGPTWQSTDGGQWAGRSDVKFSTGKHLSFAGAGNYVNIPNHSSLQGMSQLSIELWAKSDVNETNNAMLSKSSGSNYVYDYAIAVGHWIANPYVCFVINNQAVTIKSDALFPTSQWWHIVVTYNGAEVAMYINGVKQQNTAAYSSPISSTGYPIKLGYIAVPTVYEWGGMIDEVRIYNRAPSVDEINAHYYRRKYSIVNPDPYNLITLGSEEAG